MIPGEDSFHKVQEEVQTEEVCEELAEEPEMNMTMQRLSFEKDLAAFWYLKAEGEDMNDQCV